MRSKKFVVVYALAIFLIVMLVTINAVCSISQFEIYCATGSTFGAARAEAVQSRLDEEYRGKSFLFFNENSVYDAVSEEGGGYLEVLEVQKVFPNKITVSVSERFETFAFEKDGRYYAVGDDGTVLAIRDSAISNIGINNTVVTGFTFPDQKVGDVFTVDASCQGAYAALQALMDELKERDVQYNAEKIMYGTMGASDPQFNYSYFYVTAVENVGIWNEGPETRTDEKIQAALDYYESLDDGQRTYGYISVVEETGSGQIKPSYSHNVPPISDDE